VENTNNHNSSGTSTNLDLLLLLLDSAELISDGRAVLAIMAIENLLYLQDTLAPELVLASLLGLLGAWAHQLGGSIRELWNAERLSLWRLLLLDLLVFDRLQLGVLSLGPVEVLGLVRVDILPVHLHLIGVVAGHGSIHLHLLVVVDDLPPLGLHPRLTHGGDEDATGASTFLGYR
jgi:hypothetical protein